jgi:iron complex outermembrane receptor protein
LANDATLQLSYQDLRSDGYLSNSAIHSQNATLKYELPVGDASLLTAFASVNDIRYYQPDSNKGATLTQISQFGKNYQLNDTPGTMNYWGYNFTDKATDFSYLRLRTDWRDGWKTDNTVYTYAYTNQTTSTTDPTGNLASNPLQTKDLNRNTISGDVPGIDKLNKYRVIGDIFKASKQMDTGLMRTGVWYEASFTDRHQYDMDLTTGMYSRSESTVNASYLAGTNRPIDSVKFDQQSSIHTVQPFVEYEWNYDPQTKVTPGVKYASINRNVYALVEQTTRQLNHQASVDYQATLPFLTVNHKLSPELSVYGQYAQGIQIPDLNTFYIANPSNNSTDPQRSTNYQVGVVGKTDRFAWDVDLYKIFFQNKLVSNGLSGVNAGFLNIGGAIYQGIEAQMTYVVGGGFSVYANGSLNDAKSSDYNQQISGAPEYTAALGGLYGVNEWSGSLIYKLVGPVRQKDYDPTKAPVNGLSYFDYYQTPAFGTLDLGIAYTLRKPTEFGKSLKLQLNVFNLLDSSAVTSVSTGPSVAYDTYIFQAPRSVQISVKAAF